MKHRVRLSEQASREIEQAYLYIRHDAPERARRWRERLLSAIRSLKTFPERHAVCFDAAAAGSEVRQMSYGSYFVLYTIRQNIVYVLTVRHSARRPIEPSELSTPE